MPQCTVLPDVGTQTKMRAAPYASPPKHSHETSAAVQSGTRWQSESAAITVNICYKNKQPASGEAKIGKDWGKHKKPRENRQIHSQTCANNRNKTQQSVKKKAKIAAQQRKKRIKTTTGKAPGRHSVYRIANSNPNKKSARPTNRGNCGAEHAMHNKTSENDHKQSQTQKKTPPNKGDTHQRRLSRGAVRSDGRIHPRTTEIPSQTKKHSGRPRQTDSTNQAEQKKQNKPYQ